MPNLLVFRPGTEDIEEYGWHGMLLTPWLIFTHLQLDSPRLLD